MDAIDVTKAQTAIMKSTFSRQPYRGPFAACALPSLMYPPPPAVPLPRMPKTRSRFK